MQVKADHRHTRATVDKWSKVLLLGCVLLVVGSGGVFLADYGLPCVKDKPQPWGAEPAGAGCVDRHPRDDIPMNERHQRPFRPDIWDSDDRRPPLTIARPDDADRYEPRAPSLISVERVTAALGVVTGVVGVITALSSSRRGILKFSS
jgi:hypothetical protein